MVDSTSLGHRYVAWFPMLFYICKMDGPTNAVREKDIGAATCRDIYWSGCFVQGRQEIKN